MGRYDNYSNKRNIIKAEKYLNKLKNKRKPNLYKIDQAEEDLAIQKLFETCQIFGREDLFKSGDDPNSSIMFSDDNKVVLFGDTLIKYNEIKSYCFITNIVKQAHTTTETHKNGTIGRALVGGALFGVTGAVVGAVSAGSTSESNTTYSEEKNGYKLKINLIDNSAYEMDIPNTLFGGIPKSWVELGTKLDKIINSNHV